MFIFSVTVADKRDSMATYINNYGGMGSTNTSRYGVTGCKWKPRKVSAKRDFPKAFEEVAMHHTKLSNVEPPALLDVPQNISGDGHDGVSQLPVKFALYATAFSRYAPLNVEPLKSDSLISADVKFALLKFSFT